MQSPVNEAGLFLVNTLFGLYILAVMLRFLLQWARADFYNPIVQFLVKITNPPLLPLRRFIPGLMGLDMAAVVLLVVLQFVELSLVSGMQGYSPGFGQLMVLSLAQLLELLLNVFIFAIIIQAILSWINPNPYNPAMALLNQLTYPVLRPARQLLPPVSGIDLSPLIALVALYLVRILVVGTLYGIAGGG
ncbi:MAG: YggT family protein [Candidatus Competibacteraceae bacterium]|nr:YggT family protein [Candidatus Competibacteraceae bacterium]